MRRTDSRVALGLYRSRHERGLLEGALTLGVRALDTSYNYLGFTSHRTLARTAGDLLPEFMISTKVGFFPGTAGAGHSLDARRLHEAVEESAEDLCRPPDVVLLHNPERTLASLPPDAGSDCLASACTALHGASTTGLCGSWGVSSWDPRPVLAVLTSAGSAAIPTPDVLMSRAGLLVSADILDTCDTLAARWDLDVSARWGMSPFAGHATDPVWATVNVHAFLEAREECSALQAAFRAAYELPPVSRIAVGTNSVEHLRDLVTALRLRADKNRIGSYRELLRAKATTAK
ncbi:MAG: aldo/keto reductase [Pseudonocardiaceae bacterium]